jgi:hypothetical protein
MMGAEGFGSDSLQAAAGSSYSSSAGGGAPSPKKKGKPVDRAHVLEMVGGRCAVVIASAKRVAG